MLLRLLVAVLILWCSSATAQHVPAAPGGAASRPASRLTEAAPPEHAVASGLAEPPDRSPDRRLGALFDRYLWVVPVTAGHRVSLGGACLLLLALVVQLAAKMVDLEPRTFGRCMLVGTLAFAGMLAELCLAPVHPLWLVGLGIVNVLGWLLATRCVFGARGWSGLGMLVCLTLAILVGVLLLEISGFLLGGHQTE